MRVGKSNWRIDPALTDLSSFTSWPSFHSRTITVARKRFSTVQRKRERKKLEGRREKWQVWGTGREISRARLEKEAMRVRKQQTNDERAIQPPLTPVWKSMSISDWRITKCSSATLSQVFEPNEPQALKMEGRVLKPADRSQRRDLSILCI